MLMNPLALIAAKPSLVMPSLITGFAASAPQTFAYTQLRTGLEPVQQIINVILSGMHPKTQLLDQNFFNKESSE